MSFEDYAALARQLAEQRRAGERDAAAESERRRGLHATVDYLHERLNAQGYRLDQLGRAIGVDQPAGDPAVGSGPSAGPGSGDGGFAGAAGVPGRADVGAYPQLPVGEARLALPTAVSPAGAGVPAQRAPAVDPAVELELARRMADEADRHGQQAELLAQRPALLPTWSPLGRAVAVYAACGVAAGVLVLALVLASGVGLVDGFTLGAWICAGLPALAFFGGYLVLGRWGRPAMVVGTPPRYLPLGFLICFLLVPMAYCGYLLMVRGLR
ncbi:hypothetical protein [Micromonospora vulcania]|uniref:DUF1707 domain-containing protein n=1 Tax=Micromonospora vulcania TaxID=1441873 RepID=A0ABW1H2I9_9ACTN